MSRLERTCIALLMAFPLLAGCGAVEQARKAAQGDAAMRALRELGLAYHTYHDRNGTAPKTWDDLVQAGLPPEHRQALESQGYVLNLGVDLKDATVGTSNFILAYPANATGTLVTVLKLDGSVQNITPQELTQALADQQSNMGKAVIVKPGAS